MYLTTYSLFALTWYQPKPACRLAKTANVLPKTRN